MSTNVDDSVVLKTCVSQDSRFPLSPITIPETPESEKKRRCPTKTYSEDPRSPVSRRPPSQGLTCKTRLLSTSSLQLQNRMSPKSGDTLESENGIGHFGSLKRLMHGSETHQKAKRPRTGQLQKSSEQDSSSEAEDLGKYLQIIRETADLKDEKTIKGFSVRIEKKPGKAEETLSKKNSSVSTLSGQILGNMTSVKRNGATGSVTKLPRVGHHKISSSEDEKENIPLSTEPCKDLTETSSDNQSDLVASYSSWVRDSDGGEKKEDVLVCGNGKESEVKNLGDNKKSITTAEENFSILDDSWFIDQMEQNFEEPEHKKSKLECVIAYFFIHALHKNELLLTNIIH